MSTDVHTLSGAYALNALAPEEAAEFRRHLEGCQACREEVRELQGAVARMGAAEAVAPPPDLKNRILTAADRTRQEPPSTPRPGPAAAAAAPTPASEPTPITRAKGSSTAGGPAGRGRWVTWLAAAAAAIVVAGAGAIGIRAMLEDDLAPGPTRVFEAQDAHTATVETARGGELTVAVSASRDEMAVDTRDLPVLDENHVYQLWSVHGDEMESAAILTDPEVGAAMGMPGEETQVALTVEPAGGSEQPTTEPIVVVDPYEVLRS